MDDGEENGAKTWYCQVSIPKKLCSLYSRRVQKERTILKYGHCGHRPVPRSVGQAITEGFVCFTLVCTQLT